MKAKFSTKKKFKQKAFVILTNFYENPNKLDISTLSLSVRPIMTGGIIRFAAIAFGPSNKYFLGR